MSAHRHFSPEDTRSARDSDERADSSWISVFSLVSRPAWSFLQRYFPGRSSQSAFEMKSSLSIEGPLKVACLHCQRGNGAHASPGDPATLTWFTQEALNELGIHDTSLRDLGLKKQPSVGYLGTARNLLSQVLLNTQERRNPGAGCDLCPDAVSVRSSNSLWWGGLWEGDDRPQNLLLSLAQNRNDTDTSWRHCGEHHSVSYCQSRLRVAVAGTTEPCVCSSDGRSMHSESAGPLCFKELTRHTLKPESLPNSHQLPLDAEPQLLVCIRACDGVAVLTPDQDNGYSSLEEEHLNSKRHMKLLSKEQEVSETTSSVASENDPSHINSRESEFQSQRISCVEEAKEEASVSTECDESAPLLSTPQCQNKVIAYIMGSPCSGESESEDDSDWDSNDDDGFDSEGSSHFSESEDSSDESDGGEADSETERLWNSLCQNGDPYNPRNFSAPIRTASKPSSTTTDSSISESPPALLPHPSSPLLSENESSEDACEVDEDENQRLWNSFSCSSDPYSLLNFQASIQTQKTPKGCRKEKAPGAPLYKREDAEERLDSGFSEISPVPCSGSAMAVQLKKVTFVEEVEEFYASSDEDRRGPWEEMARDRCRFQRRVQEVEEAVSYCLSPTFRLGIFQRLNSTS